MKNYEFETDSVVCFWKCFNAWEKREASIVKLSLPNDVKKLDDIHHWRFAEKDIITMARLKNTEGQVSGETFLNFLQRWRPKFHQSPHEPFYSVSLLDALCINLHICFQIPKTQ